MIREMPPACRSLTYQVAVHENVLSYYYQSTLVTRACLSNPLILSIYANILQPSRYALVRPRLFDRDATSTVDLNPPPPPLSIL